MNDSHKELRETIYEVRRLLKKRNKKGSLKRKEMKEALRNACNTFDSFLKNEENYASLVKWDDEHKKLTGDSKKYNKYFIHSEYRTLKNAGIDKETRIVLVKVTRPYRKEIPVSSDYRSHIKNDIIKGKNDLLDLLDLLDELNKTDEDLIKGKKSVQKNWSSVFRLVGGVVLVGLNAPIAIAEPVTSAISSAIGGSLIGASIK